MNRPVEPVQASLGHASAEKAARAPAQVDAPPRARPVVSAGPVLDDPSPETLMALPTLTETFEPEPSLPPDDPLAHPSGDLSAEPAPAELPVTAPVEALRAAFAPRSPAATPPPSADGRTPSPARPQVRDAGEYARRMQLVQRFGRVGLWEREIASGTGHWDAESYRIMGFDPKHGAPTMSLVMDRLAPDERQSMIDAWAQSIEQRGVGQVRFRISGDDGRRRLVQSVWEIECDARGEPVRGVGVFFDETQALESTWQLAELTRRFELAASLGDLGVFQFDPDSGISRWDARMCAILELDRRELELPKAEVLRYIHPDDEARVRRADEQAIASGRAVQLEYRMRTARGNERRVLSRRVASREPRTNRIRINGVVFDVTDSWRQRQVLERLVHRLQLATTIGGIGIWDWQSADARWAINSVLRQHLGLSADDGAVGGLDTLVGALHPDDREPFRANVMLLLSGRLPAFSGEYRTLDPGRRIRYLSFQAQAQQAPSGEVFRITGVCLDITSQKHDALRRQFLVDLASDGVWEWSVPTARTQRSQSYRKTLGFRADEVDETDAQRFERVHPADRDRVRAANWALVDGRSEMLSLEYRLLDANGGWRWIIERAAAVERDVDGRALRVLGSFVDTTWQHEVERQLRDEQELISMAATLSGMGVWVWNGTEGQFDFDEHTRALYGITDDSAIPQERWIEYVHPADRESVLGLLGGNYVGSRNTFNLEFRIRRADSQQRVLAARGSFECDAEGRPVRGVGVSWDVTEQRRVAEVARAREAAERASAAKSEFLSRASHELRTPLNAVLGFAELMDGAVGVSPLDERRRGYLDRIREAGGHLKKLIDELLELSRIESGGFDLQRVPVELRSMLAEGLSMVSVDPRASDVRLHLDPGDGRPLYALADGLRLREVFWNLLSNAIKYNRPGGEVFVSVLPHGPDTVSIVVRDTGIGIDPAAMSHLFEPFNRLGREHSGIEGFGIGLSVSKGFIDRMGGELRVTSSPGEGSTFEVRMPRAPSGEAEAVGQPPTDAPQALPAADALMPELAQADAIEAGALEGAAVVELPLVPQPDRLSRPAAPARGATAVTSAQADDPSPRAAPRAITGTEVGAATGTVLYVEDNALNRLLVEQYAQARGGVALLSASTGEEGLAMAASLRPDLILIDIHLPDMTGFDLFARLQAQGWLPPAGCVALSADATSERIEAAAAAGFIDYWTKPITPDAFLQGLDRLLARPRDAA